ncbi:MAG: Asp-tRNA(Asn)/Glu-tRNA(Gln) amidotransferase subunit GatB [Chloroflexi bacterium]|nr:Asp-tRNA(Asn)/Glu-tRNA(Gln) amidotransferase subunit GatB [Chloroflexota bacterium]
MSYLPTIGLETHVQLRTVSKMFCSCSAHYADALANTHVCPVCMGAPGVLPVINAQAVRFTILSGLALNCTINTFSRFDRKNYPYPDLVKGYQISQYDNPLCIHGYLDITTDGEPHRVRIRRIHLEEDTAKLTHVTGELGEGESLIDINRSGVPLMEIVSEPDLRTPQEARQYLQALRLVLVTIGVASGNLEEGALRFDVNISLRAESESEFGAKVEIKNLNSFRSVQRALEYEIARQTQALEQGQHLVQETRGWLDDRGITVSQRTKEFAHDYRYFPEPDLPPLILSQAEIDALRASLPELPEARRQRLISTAGLSSGDASVIAADVSLARYYDELVHNGAPPKPAANWLLNDLLGLLNSRGESLETSRVTPARLTALIALVQNGTISTSIGRQVLAKMLDTDVSAGSIVAAEGLAQVSDTHALVSLIEETIDANAKALVDYLSGKEAAFNSFVGPVMKATRGKANPAIVRDLLRQALDRRRATVQS